jgi:hypothetical protein
VHFVNLLLDTLCFRLFNTLGLLVGALATLFVRCGLICIFYISFRRRGRRTNSMTISGRWIMGMMVVVVMLE